MSAPISACSGPIFGKRFARSWAVSCSSAYGEVQAEIRLTGPVIVCTLIEVKLVVEQMKIGLFLDGSEMIAALLLLESHWGHFLGTPAILPSFT
ncbi:hypothetical protein AVEN_235418-1 [Araneus ventricosus]|uniref:Uncharacterized protein n=1 Tax=Araneus ventricosus TaxID=182803 RepID=A0A4Y2A5G1_ARAVE|nr:hypothetical protein AVEN_235418-1 [Araneus ventricosus]